MRRFKLTNAAGQTFDLMRKDAFLHEPDGLGFSRSVSSLLSGESWLVTENDPEQPQPTGEIVFKGYEQYQEFMAFISFGGLYFWYAPLDKWYSAPCIAINLGKSEIEQGTLRLICPITFLLESQWTQKETVTIEPIDGGKIYLAPTVAHVYYGFTTQSGSGNPSPENIRPIANLSSPIVVENESQKTEISLQAPLHEGDKVETNVQSEYDEFVEFDGSSDENWLLEDGSVAGASGSKRFWVKLPGKQTENTSTKVAANASSNYLEVTTSDDTYNGKYDNVFDVVYTYSTNMIHIRIAGIKTVEDLKNRLQQKHLKVYYKSVDGGTGKNVRRETHVKKTLVLDGDKVKFTELNNYWNLTYYTSPNISATPKCICNAFPGSIFNSNTAYSIIFTTKTLMSPYFENVDACNTFLAEQYAAGTPVTIEYELAQPEVFADDAIPLSAFPGYYSYPYKYGSPFGGSYVVQNDTSRDAALKLTIFGPGENPRWSVVNGNTVQRGKVNAVLAMGHKIVMNSSDGALELAEYTNENEFVKDLYADGDFSTVRFVKAKPGQNIVSFEQDGSAGINTAVEVIFYAESV